MVSAEPRRWPSLSFARPRAGVSHYERDNSEGSFELQISYHLNPVLEPRPLTLVPQAYFARIECGVPDLFGLDPYEKLMACNRRLGGSAKDDYDLHLWSERPLRRDARPPPRRAEGTLITCVCCERRGWSALAATGRRFSTRSPTRVGRFSRLWSLSRCPHDASRTADRDGRFVYVASDAARHVVVA
jgi:hypothetical protein